MDEHARGAITCLTFRGLAAVPGLVHAVSTRPGGVSAPPFDSLNMGSHVGDDPRSVLENRRRFASAAGFALEEVVTTRQIHGVTVRAVGRKDHGTGALEPPAESWACDALVTADEDVFLMGFSADCPLVMLVDPDASGRVIALAHAGWRSAFGGILARTVAEMSRLGARPERITGAISPAIGPCCYEVGGELIRALPKEIADPGRLFKPRGKRFLLDLPLACRELLMSAGVREGNIETAGICTMCRKDLLFSYRAGAGKTGRHAAVIGRIAQPSPG